ncbi:aminopeptidase N [Nocardioides ferulae]|uniref:aminopeptidase N n=1 Tax=Nocardioides ferulae TaxID=2340821 RepID=UPI000EB1278C|nr:aminopeptidase N [Nocardioides ferulae]
MSLTLEEARARAAAVSAVEYDVHLDLTGPPADGFASRTVVRFVAAGPETFLELAGGRDVRVWVDGAAVADPGYSADRLPLHGLSGRTEVVVEARLPYVTDGDGMHTFTDPADGERYVSAYCGMDNAQRVLACFDQPDLRAPVSLTVDAQPGWTVLANGRSVGSAADRSGGRWRFAPTPPIPPYLFVVCAGPWHSVTWEHAGLPFGLHARASLAAELARDAAELRATAEACFAHYRDLFTEPYAFDSYDQVFVPGLNWGAMEMPGCVTFRDELLPRGRITDREREQRAMIVAHEMAHMWFGDLVTMRWWEDSWLSESFADYLGFRVAADAAGFSGAQVGFEVGQKPGGYDADRRRSTHPVAAVTEEVVDVDTAFGNFDMISYAKGNAAVRQLVTWLGDEPFFAGVNDYLTRHRLGSATLADFVAALEGATDRDVRGWVEAWLRTTGHDTIRVERDGEIPVLHRDGTRPHRVLVKAYDGRLGEVGRRLVDLGDAPVPLPEWAGRVVLPNAGGETFARLRLDELSSSALRSGLSALEDPLARSVVWAMLFEMVASRDLPATDYLLLVERLLPDEADPVLVEAVVRRTRAHVVPFRVPAGEAAAAADALARACREGLDRSHAAGEQRTLALARGLAATSRDEGLLGSWLEHDRTDTGLTLDPALRWQALHRLAELGAADAGRIERERRRDGSAQGDLAAATALAARPTTDAKDAAWREMTDDAVSTRRFEALANGLWSAEQADLLAPYVGRYLAQAPAIARRRGQAFAQEVGHAVPRWALDADQVASLEAALRGDVPTVLKRAWEDWRDDLR